MKRILLLLCTLSLAASGAMSQQPESGVGSGKEVGFGPGRPGIPSPRPGIGPSLWATYTVEGEEFSVNLPIWPAMTTTKVARKGDGKHRLERQLKTSSLGVFYSIEVFENPEPRQSLEDFIAEKNANSEYDPATERSRPINGFIGKEYSSRNKTSPAVVQFFATENRLFRFAASGSGESGPEVKQFFSSIKLGEKTGGIKVSDGPGPSVFRGDEVDEKPRLITKPEPIYTEDARREHISGVVILKVIFSATGEVTNIRVVSGLSHGLTDQAIGAAKKIKFIPATKDGKPVSMWMQLEYNFNL